jgi:membrane associated rhomboid family serine protease
MVDNRCDFCGKYEMLPFNCKYCGGVYCSSHRLPEYHECTGLRMMKEGTWKPPTQSRKPQPVAARRGLRLPKVRLPARGYYAYILIAACVLVFILQYALPSWFTNNLVLSRSSLLSAPWTLVTYMFLHADIWHILFNMLMLFFLGRILERQIGSVRFLGLFLGSGILAGLVQVLLFPAFPVIGASGAIMGVLGALTILLPDLRIYLYFIPMKLWQLTILLVAFDVLLLRQDDMIAHGAHLVGLAVGLLYGYILKMNRDRVHAYWPV